MTVTVRVRPAASHDVLAVREIYARHVLDGVGSFELEPPSVAEMHRRFAAVIARSLPFLVSEDDVGVRGYAYAAPYRDRPAYRFTVESSVYVDPAAMRRGFGLALMTELVDRCEASPLGLRQMVAVIGDNGNEASIGLHRRVGFVDVGVLRAVGWKHERWLDTVLMQRSLGANGIGPLGRDHP